MYSETYAVLHILVRISTIATVAMVYSLTTAVRGYHIYKAFWITTLRGIADL